MDARTQGRFEVSQPVRWRLGSQGDFLWGMLMDFSGKGLRLLVAQKTSRGATLQVQWGNTFLSGTVRHCRAAADGFLVGVELRRPMYETEPQLPKKDSEVKTRARRRNGRRDFAGQWEILRRDDPPQG